MAPPTAPHANVPPGTFPDYRRSVSLQYVKEGYTALCKYGFTLLLLPVIATVGLELANLYRRGDVARMVAVAAQTDLTLNLVTVMACSALLAAALLAYWLMGTRPVYLVDFAVFRPPEEWRVTAATFKARSVGSGKFTAESLDFQNRIMARSGLDDATYIPPALMATPPVISMAMARKEFEEVMFAAVADVLAKTGVHPSQIGVLVVNCSLFNPTPSLSAMLINRFKLNSNIVSYNLAGMGCSAGIIAIDLARQMLQLQPRSYALVASTENITQNWYFGNNRSMLMPNCLFRAGGAAMLLSNRRRDRWTAKYELCHVVRTHLGANDSAYSCIFQQEDEAGGVGVSLSKELLANAGEALKANITKLGPLVLPLSEQLLFLANLIARKAAKVLSLGRLRPYIPDFKLAFDHVCIHTGGRAVVDEIEKQLRLTKGLCEPSRATLFRYGNTSSSSIWYVLAYLESQVGVRRGQRVWQLGFGSGFKCNSAVWRSLRRNNTVHKAWEGFDRAAFDALQAELEAAPTAHAKKTQ